MAKIIGHQREQKILNNAILGNRIASAYLFVGIDGIGKDAIALEFAQILNCMNPIKTEENIHSCGECKHCKQFENLSNTNLDYVFSLPSGKSSSKKSDSPLDGLSKAQIDEIKEQLLMKAENRYHRISLKSASRIKIAQIRQIKHKLSRSGSLNSGRRIVIISRADEMTTEASNAFLKTLEEPHSNITIILTTSKPGYILQTIKSRTQIINFSPLPDSLIIKELLEKHEFTETEARIAAALGQGSFTLAETALTQETAALRKFPAQLLRVAFKKNYYRTDLLAMITELLNNDKDAVIQVLNLMIFWLRDVIVYLNYKDANRIINLDQAETIQKFANAYQNLDIAAGIRIIEEAITLIPKNVNMRLIMISMFIKLRAVFIFEKEEFQIY